MRTNKRKMTAATPGSPNQITAGLATVEAAGPKRRTVLRGSLATAAASGLSLALASCATTGASGDDTEDQPQGETSEDNPFGMAENTVVDAVIFDGGYGTDYAKFAGEVLAKAHPGSSVKVTGTSDVAQKMQPRFVGGNPPDLLDNSGGGRISDAVLRDRVEDLTDVVEAKNLEGTPIKDTLYPGALDVGTVEGSINSISYVMNVYAVWYSASLMEENGWQVPSTWEEVKELGAQAKQKGLYLFGWGMEGATYYETLAIDSAIKQGGDEVRLGLENLDADGWSHPAMQSVLEAMKECIDEGYFMPGGAGAQFTAAQAQWSMAKKFLLYPTGSWIENEMKDQTAEDFQMTGVPAFTIDDNPAMPKEAVHASPGEAYLVPSDGNTAAGKELLRTMLSKEAATNFSQTTHTSTIVKGLVPDDGFGSTALLSQTDMLDAAGENVISFNFMNYYGLNSDHLPIWNSFLAGRDSVESLTKKLQSISDRVREDDTVEKVNVS